MKIAVIGGNGRVGHALVGRLACDPQLSIVSIGRRKPPLHDALPENVTFAQVASSEEMAEAIAEATHVVNCASLYLNDVIYAHPPRNLQRVILVGSTRAYTAFADKHADAIRLEEEKFERSGLPGVLLQPSMVYGGGDKNVSHIAYFLTKTPVVPLPQGGRSLIQPVHYEDVVAALESAVFSPNAAGKPIILAGPRAITIKELIEAVAKGIGRKVRVVSVPSSFLYAAAAVTRRLPGLPNVSRFQVERMLEDRAFDISAMRERLGVNPREFAVDASILESRRR